MTPDVSPDDVVMGDATVLEPDRVARPVGVDLVAGAPSPADFSTPEALTLNGVTFSLALMAAAVLKAAVVLNAVDWAGGGAAAGSAAGGVTDGVPEPEGGSAGASMCLLKSSASPGDLKGLVDEAAPSRPLSRCLGGSPPCTGFILEGPDVGAWADFNDVPGASVPLTG